MNHFFSFSSRRGVVTCSFFGFACLRWISFHAGVYLWVVEQSDGCEQTIYQYLICNWLRTAAEHHHRVFEVRRVSCTLGFVTAVDNEVADIVDDSVGCSRGRNDLSCPRDWEEPPSWPNGVCGFRNSISRLDYIGCSIFMLLMERWLRDHNGCWITVTRTYFIRNCRLSCFNLNHFYILKI